MRPDFYGHALLYRRLGLRIFSVARLIRGDDGELRCGCYLGESCDAPGKHPVAKGWRDGEDDISRWRPGPLAKPSIGIVTGADSGIVVLDVDPRNGGEETLAQLKRRYGTLPETWRFLTGGGGQHILFRHPGGYVKSKAGALGAGLDCKAEGGLIVAPPSLHMSGRRYAIDPDHHPDELPLADLSEWLHTMLLAATEKRTTARQRGRPRPERPVRPSAGLSRYAEAALNNACRRIVAAPCGQQEVTLNAECYGIGRLAGAVPGGFALRALRFAAQRMPSYDGARPWQDYQLAEKVEHAFNDGMRNPRRSG
jgi:Bifunctional DNA primase/polymerase, N-terminal